VTRLLLRGTAVAIAIAGAIDPAITASRPIKPRVALLGSAALPDPALVDRVASSIDSSFTVIRESAEVGAEAVVSVGEQLPAVANLRAPVAFAVLPEPQQPYVAIESVTAPDRAHLDARVPVTARVRVVSAEGRKLTIALRKDGVEVDRVTHDVAAPRVVSPAALSFVASAPGASRLEVVAEVEGARRPAEAAVLISTGRARWAVLSYDSRPSWGSTFVRRALETDPRFIVTSRVRTTANHAASAGKPPASLSSPEQLESYDVVLVGAPQELGDADVTGLEAFMRRHGGAVILLLDEPRGTRDSTAVSRLTGVTEWTSRLGAEPIGDPPASEFTWPARQPAWAEALGAPWRTDGTTKTNAPPAVWRMSVGRGHLIVNGALDGWRYRQMGDAFDRFWVAASAEAASRSAAIGSAPQALPAPSETQDLAQPSPDERPLVTAWAASRRGRAIAESDLASLRSELERVLAPPREPYTFHPMRSPWWIVPFGALAGFEWWSRRRQGHR
jgi:hypothetical protein